MMRRDLLFRGRDLRTHSRRGMGEGRAARDALAAFALMKLTAVAGAKIVARVKKGAASFNPPAVDATTPDLPLLHHFHFDLGDAALGDAELFRRG